ncbi:MAG: HEPN domain-containing protein [Acidilobaceae archaeon]
MSGEFVGKLKRRSEDFVRAAEMFLERGSYDLACFSADQAVQLYVKAVVFRFTGEMPRIHGVRGLLGYLASRLYEAGYRGYAEAIVGFARENRYALAVLEDAYIEARYGLRSFTEEDARLALEVSSRLIKLLGGVEDAIWRV